MPLLVTVVQYFKLLFQDLVFLFVPLRSPAFAVLAACSFVEHSRLLHLAADRLTRACATGRGNKVVSEVEVGEQDGLTLYTFQRDTLDAYYSFARSVQGGTLMLVNAAVLPALLVLQRLFVSQRACDPLRQFCARAISPDSDGDTAVTCAVLFAEHAAGALTGLLLHHRPRLARLKERATRMPPPSLLRQGVLRNRLYDNDLLHWLLHTEPATAAGFLARTLGHPVAAWRKYLVPYCLIVVYVVFTAVQRLSQ